MIQYLESFIRNKHVVFPMGYQNISKEKNMYKYCEVVKYIYFRDQVNYYSLWCD